MKRTLILMLILMFVLVGFGEVLFVEDPGNLEYGPLIKPDPVWVATLDSILGIGNHGWWGPTTAQAEDGPPLDTMQNYLLVIWNCYDYWLSDPGALTFNDMNNIGTYLTGGGKVWLIGQDILYSGVPYSWMGTYFHLDSAFEDYGNNPLQINLHGLAEINCISFTANLDYQLNSFLPDALIPNAAQAHHILEDLTFLKFPCIASPNAGALQTSFWTIDGRSPDPWDNWIQMVTGMFDAFDIFGISEIPMQKPAGKLHLQISPVPFINSTTINYNLPDDSNVKLQVFDKLGRHVITLINEYKRAGTYKITWNSKDKSGLNVADGVYFLKLTCGESSCIVNLVLVR